MALGIPSAGRSEKRDDLVDGRMLPRDVLGQRPGRLGVPLADCVVGPGLGICFPWPDPGWSRLVSVMCPTLPSLSHSLWAVSAALHPGKGPSSTTCKALASPGTERGLQLQAEALLAWVPGTQSQLRNRGHCSPADTMLGPDVLGKRGEGLGICVCMGRGQCG